MDLAERINVVVERETAQVNKRSEHSNLINFLLPREIETPQVDKITKRIDLSDLVIIEIKISQVDKSTKHIDLLDLIIFKIKVCQSSKIFNFFRNY